MGGWRTLPGVGVASSQRFRRGVASVPVRPGVGVASQRLCPGVKPGVAPPRPGVAPNSSARPGVASQRLTDGVASVVSQSDVRAFLLQGNIQNLGQWNEMLLLLAFQEWVEPIMCMISQIYPPTWHILFDYMRGMALTCPRSDPSDSAASPLPLLLAVLAPAGAGCPRPLLAQHPALHPPLPSSACPGCSAGTPFPEIS